MDKRSEIIKNAVLEKLSDGIDFFTADDILTVAGISDADLQAIQQKIVDDLNKFPQEDISTLL